MLMTIYKGTGIIKNYKILFSIPKINSMLCMRLHLDLNKSGKNIFF